MVAMRSVQYVGQVSRCGRLAV